MLPKNLLCFSPYRWDLSMYRPHQLMLRFAEMSNVYYFEEPIFDSKKGSFLSFSTRSETLWKIVPHLMDGLTAEEINNSLGDLLNMLLMNADMENWMFWYYCPQPPRFTRKYHPRLAVYDFVVEPEDRRRTIWDDLFNTVYDQVIKEAGLSSIIEVQH